MIDKVRLIGNGTFPEEWVGEAVEALSGDALLVHPTETVHGIGCRVDSEIAVTRIRSLKGREESKRFVLLVPEPAWLDEICENVRPEAFELVRSFWPGPLTVVFETNDSARRRFPCLGETVALRQTPHPFTSRVVSKSGLPMVSTSLNLSGRPPVSDPISFLETLEDKVELAVVDRSMTADLSALPSTVIGVKPDGTLAVLREGAVSVSRVRELTGLKFTWSDS